MYGTRCHSILKYDKSLDLVDSFYYLGHTVRAQLSDDTDTPAQLHKLNTLGSVMIRELTVCPHAINLESFGFVAPLYNFLS